MSKKEKRKTTSEEMQTWFKTNEEVIFHIEWMQSTFNAIWREVSDRLTKIEARLQILEADQK